MNLRLPTAETTNQLHIANLHLLFNLRLVEVKQDESAASLGQQSRTRYSADPSLLTKQLGLLSKS